MKRFATFSISLALVMLAVVQFLPSVSVQAGGLTGTPDAPTATPTAGTPAPTATPTNTPTPGPSPTSTPVTYALVNVPDRGTLSIRTGPSTWYPIVGAFGAQQKDIPVTGNIAGDHPRIWFEVRRTGGGLGWISGHYVTEYVKPEVFCKDERTKTLVSDLAKAVASEDGKLLASIASANHGITLRLFRNGPAYNFFYYLPNLFNGTYSINWGKAPGAYQNEVGGFGKIVTPRLKDVFGSGYEIYCNDASKTGSADPWPPEYANINFLTVYKPESKVGAKDWRAWLVGVDYVSGKPGVFALIHFQP